MHEITHLEVYVDQLGGIMLGYPTSKLTFVSLRQNQSSDPTNAAPDQRHAVTVTIPTQSLMNACNAISKSIRENQDALLENAQESTKLLEEALLASVKASSAG
jgi:hypothetical protein